MEENREYRIKAAACSSFDDLTTLLKSLLAVTSPEVTFMDSYSRGTQPDLNKNPIITYRIVSRKPADKELKPQLRESIRSDTEHLDIYGQKFEYIVEFCIWADTNRQADEVLDKFEDTINVYKGNILNSGVQRFIFLEQLEDEAENRKNKLICRPLHYLIRLERLTISKGPLLKLITVRANEGLIFKIMNEEE